MPLPPAKEYRRRAAAARQQAEGLPSGPEREGLFKIADQWECLAQYKEEEELD
jgi:hypothetical protein